MVAGWRGSGWPEIHKDFWNFMPLDVQYFDVSLEMLEWENSTPLKQAQKNVCKNA